MPFPHSLRSRFALLMTLLSWLLGTPIGQDASKRIREEVGRDLAEASAQMVDRLDRDMASRADYLQVLASRRGLRQLDAIGEIRALLDRLQQEIPGIAWICAPTARSWLPASATSSGRRSMATLARRHKRKPRRSPSSRRQYNPRILVDTPCSPSGIPATSVPDLRGFAHAD